MISFVILTNLRVLDRRAPIERAILALVLDFDVDRGVMCTGYTIRSYIAV